MSEEQSVDVIQIAGVRATHQSTSTLSASLDPAGVLVLGEIGPVEASTFAVTSAVQALGRTVYYSYALDAVSSDGTFGQFYSKSPQYAVTGPLRVQKADCIWWLAGKRGQLILTLQDGPVVTFDQEDALTLAGWMLLIATSAAIEFDGALRTVAPRIWAPGAF